MKKTLVYILFVLFSAPAFAQTDAEKAAVMVPVDNLFKGMHTGDSALVHSAFINTVTFGTVVKNKKGQTVIVPEPLSKFLEAVGTPHPEVWSEPIWETTVQVDGVFAQVWAKYAFYIDKKFLHCGVDAFQLFKGEDGVWKIFVLSDTRVREGCVVPESVKGLFN